MKGPNPNDQAKFSELLAAYGEGRYREAIELASALIKLDANQPAVLNVMGVSMQALKALGPALEIFDLCLRLSPAFIEAQSNKGNVLKDLGRMEEALSCYRQTLCFEPSFALGTYNLGNTYKELGADLEALRYFKRALCLDPKLASAGWNQALMLLRRGDYREGWMLYEYGWSAGQRGRRRQIQQPLWLGDTALVGETLLVHWEQGYGDVIQFSRYVTVLWGLGVHVVFWAPPALEKLMLSLRGIKAIVTTQEALPKFDRHCPLMSLPLALGTDLDTVPMNVPYLFPERRRLYQWQTRLGPKQRLRVGLVWSGGRAHPHDQLRSLSLETLKPLYQLSMIEFHSLQVEYRAEDLPTLEGSPIHRHDKSLSDFAETAALIANLDLVISVDTSVAHLAGALGKPVWILLHHPCDYRWMDTRSDTPWYPSVRLFRQLIAGDWSQPIGLLLKAIEEFSAEPKA